jgi:hypothetical protein
MWQYLIFGSEYLGFAEFSWRIVCPFHVKNVLWGGGGDDAKSLQQSMVPWHSSVHNEGVWGVMRDRHICG